MNNSDIRKKKMVEIASLMREKDNFVITTHTNPDPDALGCEVAFSLILKKLGKNARVINAASVPRAYSFIDNRGIIEDYRPEFHNEIIATAGALIVLDASSFERTGPSGKAMEASGATTICIDHHIGSDGCGDVNLVDPKASSVGEIIFDLCQSCGFEVDEEIARCLYVAIVADTRSFQFNNTTPRTHRVAACLLEQGVNSEDLYEALYERNAPQAAVLLGLALKNISIECEGRLAWLKITQEMKESAGTAANNSDYFLNFLRAIEGVDVMILFRDIGEGRTKVSLRGKRGIDVNSVARAFGGGGHLQASGITLNEPIDSVLEKVVAEARKLFRGR